METTWKKVHSMFSFKWKTITFSVLALIKLMLKKEFLERIFHFLHDILGILDTFRYSSSCEPVNYDFLVSFQIVIQIYNLFDMQVFYQQKERRNLNVKWCYAFFELLWNFIYHSSVVFRNLCLCIFVDA